MKEKRGKRTWLGVSLLITAILTLGGSAFGATFTNSSPITINDADLASPYPSTIAVAALGGTVTSVKVTINGFSHTFPDDVGMVLVGPTGAALLLQDGCGDDPDMVNVTYTFVDGGAVLPSLTAWTAGNYKPTTYFTGDGFPAPGPGTAYGNPGPAGSGTATFASTYNGTAPNGNWNLYVVDLAGGDVGTISGGWTLELTTNAVVNQQHVIDFDADGKTDLAVVRNTGGGPGGQLTWFIKNSTAANKTQAWGLQGDEYTPGDFDGDNTTDIAIWRPLPGSDSAFYILQSATNIMRLERFGLSTDDPSLIGDYDGDGKDDIAVYRTGVGAGNPSFWFWRTTTGGTVFTKQWGQNGDFPVPGDFDGNGSNDFVVQRNAGGGQARFWVMLSTGAVSSFVFGTPTDVILPGDYDGDGKTDIAVVRSSGGSILWNIHPSGGGADTAAFWGTSATDFPTVGDYDGDGKSDLSVWRPSVTPGQSFFLTSSSGSGFIGTAWGQNGDYPVANYNNH
jgi:subtilisin-like proprotein convertase family protein